MNVVGLGGVSTGLTIRLHCLVRASCLGTPQRNSMDLVAITGVCMVLFFCFAARCLRRCFGSRVMFDYGVFYHFQGVCPPLEVWRGLVGREWGLVCLWIGHDWARLASGRLL